MLIVNGEGDYVYKEGTKTLEESSHPVYQARIALALGQNQWLYAPTSGHSLAKFKQAKQSDAKVTEFQKELAFYLEKYGPKVTELLVDRNAVTMQLEIAEDALSG